MRWQEHAHQLARYTHSFFSELKGRELTPLTEHLREQQEFTGSGSSTTGSGVQALEGLDAQWSGGVSLLREESGEEHNPTNHFDLVSHNAGT